MSLSKIPKAVAIPADVPCLSVLRKMVKNTGPKKNAVPKPVKNPCKKAMMQKSLKR